MFKVDLTQDWRFKAVEEGGEWLTISVPGDVNNALFKAGVYPDPHIGDQYKAYFPNSGKRWLFQRTLDAPAFGENAELVFEGITGAAEIRLNGQRLGEARNAHRPHRFQIASLLKPTGNLLEVDIEPIEKTIGAARRDDFGWGNERTLLRTPPFNYGWDWSVAVPAIGLSGKVYLECDNAYRFVNVNYRTPKVGRVDFFFEVSHAARETGYELRISLRGHGVDITRNVPTTLIPPEGYVEESYIYSQHKTFTTIMVPDAKPWMPNGYGEPALYQYEVELIVNGQVADTVRGRMGFRTVRVEENPFRESSGIGFSYEIKVNDVSVFAKGSNWIPTELWPTLSKEETYRRLLKLAKDAGFTMLRIWGGGIYENDIFYDLCDEYGIMIWQDFMFASNAYPVGILREEIRQEAEYQLKRLRVHPCICHWCGINEDVFSWAYPGCGKQKTWVQADIGDYSGSGSWQMHDDPEIYSMILRGLTSLLGNDVPYIESSPASRGDCGNLPQSGNCHVSSRQYLNLHKTEFRGHFNQFCSFDSEFSVQGPDYGDETKRFLGEENCREWPPSGERETVWIGHLQRSGCGALWAAQAESAQNIFGTIDSFETFIKYGQALHLELSRAELEYRRAERPDCGGTMGWMFNDCWPTGNWSIIDYSLRPKPAYYALKRACAPRLPIVVSRQERVEFFFDNESCDAFEVKGRLGLMKLDGTVVREQVFNAAVGPNELVPLASWMLNEDARDAGDHYFLAVEGYAVTRCFPEDWKNVAWPDSTPVLTDVRPGVVRISADAFTRLAHLAPKTKGTRIDFSDNYVDLGPGESIDIEVTPPFPASELKVLHWNTEWE